MTRTAGAGERLRLPRRGIDEDGGSGQQQRDRGDVIRHRARLAGDHGAGVEDDRDGDQGERSDAVGAADAPGGKQGEAEPAEVEQRREDVAAEEGHAGRVLDLGVLRVEPVQVERVAEVERPDRPRLREARRERAVVPEAVEGDDAAAPDVLEAGRPVDGEEDRCAQAQDQVEAADRGGRRCLAVARSVGDAEPDRQADRDGGEHQGVRVEEPDGGEQLENDREQGEAEHRLDEPRGRSLPAGQQPPSQPDGGQRERDDDGREAQHRPQVFAEGHVRRPAGRLGALAVARRDRSGRYRCRGPGRRSACKP